MTASITVVVHSEDDPPRIECDGIIELTDSVSIHLPAEKQAATGWCRDFATLLAVTAERLDAEAAQAREDLKRAAELVGDLRHDRGEVSDDGICWDCKLDDHSHHRPYNHGRCYGCSCEATP